MICTESTIGADAMRLACPVECLSGGVWGTQPEALWGYLCFQALSSQQPVSPPFIPCSSCCVLQASLLWRQCMSEKEK